MTSRVAVRRAALGVVALGVLVTGSAVTTSCGDDDEEPQLVVDGIAVLDAWVRPTPPGADEAAVYISVLNRGSTDTAVLGASSTRCAVVVPHITTFDDGVASMGEALDAELALPSDGRVAMEPNGLHLMCLGLDSPLQPGERIDVALDLADRDPIDVTVDVEQR